MDQADDRELLRRYVGRGVAAVTEPPGGPGAIQAVLPGPSGRHLLELVVPLARRGTVPPPVLRAPVRARHPGLYLPGGRWLSLAIRTLACELLLPALAALADNLAGQYDTWFWLRYHTRELGPHIRARFRGDPATLGSQVLPAISVWCQEMIRQRLSGGFTVEPFSSPGGLAASLIIGSAYLPDPDSQRAATARAVRWLAARAVDLAHSRDEHLRAGGVGTPWPIYDAINGLAGIGRVLLAALTAGYDTAESGLLAALRTLTTMIHTQHGRRPGWWLPAGEHPSAVTVHPSGAATTGMAHGIAGPVSLLATAHTAGWSVAGQRAAIQSGAHWLLRWRTEAAYSWAPYVTGDELDNDTAQPIAGRRDAWCYGAPGIGRALLLAGSALADPQLTTAGDAAIASLSERPADLWDVEGPALCHGYAGVLQSATTSHCDTGDSAVAALAKAFTPQLTFAFQHFYNGVPSDKPGLLTGSAGIALALADHGQLPAPPVPARWDSILLLS